ncbi:MAG: hypothetical protein ACREJ3_13600, partial [Polyangiaceae bacterium]
EQEVGGMEVDGRSDLFSLGAVLFECLVGEPPPPRSPSGSVRIGSMPIHQRESGTQKTGATLPPAWRTVLDKAMALHPADRYDSARSFAQALRGVQGDAAKAESRS